MKTVRDDDGTVYHLLKRSGETSLVRDPETGEEHVLDTDRLEPCAGATNLERAADTLDPALRAMLRSVHDDETLGLLVELHDRGPLAVVAILERSSWCESDLAGRLGQLQLAGLIEEAAVAGERGYRLTAEGTRAVSLVRSPPESESDGGADR